MRLVFMGTGEIALPTLRWLIESRESQGCEIAAVYTQPDKPVGRKQILTPPEVKVIAEAAGIPVRQPETLRGNEAAVAEFARFRPDLAIVMAYGQILPRDLIATPRIACVNLHASLLPRHRGASPIQAAIRDGDSETGITLMHVVPKLDAGDMILKETIPIEPTDTGGSLHDKLAELGPVLLRRGLPALRNPPLIAEPQDESLVSYSGKLERNDGHLDWSGEPETLARLIRAYDPWPGTYAFLPTPEGPKKLKIFPHASVSADFAGTPGTLTVADSSLRICCRAGSLVLHGEVQLEGKKRLPVADWLRGMTLPEGMILQ